MQAVPIFHKLWTIFLNKIFYFPVITATEGFSNVKKQVILQCQDKNNFRQLSFNIHDNRNIHQMYHIQPYQLQNET